MVIYVKFSDTTNLFGITISIKSLNVFGIKIQLLYQHQLDISQHSFIQEKYNFCARVSRKHRKENWHCLSTSFREEFSIRFQIMTDLRSFKSFKTSHPFLQVVFGEDVQLPQLTSQLQALTLELLRTGNS